jgi:hypothetical protein
MTRIVTSHYRYKRPPRKRKVVALDVPVIVSAKTAAARFERRRPRGRGKSLAQRARQPGA